VAQVSWVAWSSGGRLGEAGVGACGVTRAEAREGCARDMRQGEPSSCDCSVISYGTVLCASSWYCVRMILCMREGSTRYCILQASLHLMMPMCKFMRRLPTICPSAYITMSLKPMTVFQDIKPELYEACIIWQKSPAQCCTSSMFMGNYRCRTTVLYVANTVPVHVEVLKNSLLTIFHDSKLCTKSFST